MAPLSDAPRVFRGGVSDMVWGSPYGDYLVDLLESVPDLLFPRSVTTYAAMRNDPKIRGALAGYVLPIVRASWWVDPAGCRPEVVKLVADDLGLRVKGDDSDPGPARRRGVNFGKVLRLAVPGHLIFGFYPLEQKYDIVPTGPGGALQARLVELGERPPNTISDVKLDKGGRLESIRQHNMMRTEDVIRAAALTWFVHEQEGANVIGRSLLRSSYGPWLIKHEMLRVNATSKRRFGVGVPTFEAQPGTTPTPAQLAEAARLASSYRGGEHAGLAAPPGFVAKVKGVEGSVPDPLDFIRYLDQQITGSVLEQVLDLGQTATGSRALGSVFVDLLHMAVQSVGDAAAEEATDSLSVRLVNYNYGEDEPAPRIVCGDVSANREVTVEALAALLQSGALSSDPELEADVRQRYGLPEAAEPRAPLPASAPAPVAAAARRGRPIALGRSGDSGRAPTRAAAPSVLRRELNGIELAATTDFELVQSEWVDALDEIAASWATITAAQVSAVRAEVERIVRDGDAAELPTIELDTDTAHGKLRDAMIAGAIAAQTEQVAEAKRQGVTASTGEVDEERLGQVAAAIVGFLAGGFVASAGRKALQVWAQDSTPGQVASDVVDHLNGLGDTALRESLGAGLSAAQNEGRLAVLRASVEAGNAPEVLAASEILDVSTCGSCAAVDGKIYDTIAEAEADYASGGYVGCQGGLRCRGILVTVWDAGSIPAAA